MTDPTYEAEGLHTPESRERDARFVGHEPKGSKMTERVDLDAVRAQVMTVQTGGDVYVFADDYATLLAERDALETENQRLKMAIAIHGAEACGLLKAYHKEDGTRLATALRAALAEQEKTDETP